MGVPDRPGRTIARKTLGTLKWDSYESCAMCSYRQMM